MAETKDTFPTHFHNSRTTLKTRKSIISRRKTRVSDKHSPLPSQLLCFCSVQCPKLLGSLSFPAANSPPGLWSFFKTLLHWMCRFKATVGNVSWLMFTVQTLQKTWINIAMVRANGKTEKRPIIVLMVAFFSQGQLASWEVCSKHLMTVLGSFLQLERV